jgi:hypothetical protein
VVSERAGPPLRQHQSVRERLSWAGIPEGAIVAFVATLAGQLAVLLPADDPPQVTISPLWYFVAIPAFVVGALSAVAAWARAPLAVGGALLGAFAGTLAWILIGFVMLANMYS